MCHVQLIMLWMPTKEMDHVGTPLTKSFLSRWFLYSNFLFISVTLWIACCKLICRDYKHASNSLLDERTPWIGQQKCYKKEEGKKVLKNLTENLSGITTFFDPYDKLSMMCMIPISIFLTAIEQASWNQLTPL